MPNGVQTLVFFELVEREGHLIAKAVGFRAIDEEIQKEKVVALPAYFERENITPIVSPFFANVETILKDLAFIVSQPTRAPSF